MEHPFINNRTAKEFSKENEGYEIKNTVYNNADNKIINKDYTKYLAEVKLTKDILDEEFNEKNEKIIISKAILISRLVDDFELIKYADEKKYFNENDYFMILLNFVVLFDETTNTKFMDYFVNKNKQILKHPDFLKALIQLFEKNEDDAYLLMDWYYCVDKVIFANMIGNFLHGSKKEKILAYLEKYEDIWSVDDCVLIQSLCISSSLNEILKYLGRVKCENLPYQKFASFSLRNADEKVFLHWNNIEKYKCKNIVIALSCAASKKYETAKNLVENFEGEINNEEIIQQCAEANNTDIVKFIVESLSSKLDLHAKNDLLLRTMIINENLEAVQFLLENDEKIGKFNNQDLPTKLKKILRFLENEELIKIVKEYFSL